MKASEIFNLLKAKFPQITQDTASDAVVIPRDLLLELSRYIQKPPLAFDDLHCITAIDRKEKIELVYIFYSVTERHNLTLKISLQPQDLNVKSLASLWKSADWLERETFDLFGVTFLNHPDLRRILNPSDWKGYPLRKDYSHPGFILKPR